LSQRELGAGVCTGAYVSRIEADDRVPSLQVLFALAERAACDPWWLATGEEVSGDDLQVRLRSALAQRDSAERRLAAIGEVAATAPADAALSTSVLQARFRRVLELAAHPRR
jgi:transcriptional regulator with XRE-family HTH domain